MASTLLSRTPGSAGNRKTFTFSAWVKKSDTTSSANVIFCAGESTDDQFNIFFRDTITLDDESGNVSNFNLVTNRLFRDISAWYHIVVAVDTTQATESDRIKLYINGVQETSFSTSNYPSQNSDSNVNRTINTSIGGRGYQSSQYFNGSMAHVHFIDGTAYDADTFGSTDSTSGIWKPKTAPSVTYGTNGFFLKFQDSSSLGDDSSGNTNDFTLSGNGRQILDTPSNVFATWYADSFDKGNQVSFSNGNTTTADAGGTTDYDPKAWTTFGANAGKYYCEMKLTAFATNRSYRAGVWFTEGNFSHEANANCFSGVKYTTTGDAVTIYSFGSDVQSSLASFSAGDILGVAVDIDNGTIQYYRNGATYGSQITGLSSNFSGKSMMFCHTGEAGAGRTYTVDANFGNGYFGTTAVSSAENDDAGYGKFEYDVPAGFYALCTKNINTYG